MSHVVEPQLFDQEVHGLALLVARLRLRPLQLRRVHEHLLHGEQLHQRVELRTDKTHVHGGGIDVLCNTNTPQLAHFARARRRALAGARYCARTPVARASRTHLLDVRGVSLDEAGAGGEAAEEQSSIHAPLRLAPGDDVQQRRLARARGPHHRGLGRSRKEAAGFG